MQLKTPQTIVPSPTTVLTTTTGSSEKNSTSTPQIPAGQSTSKSGHGSILNRFKIQFENVVHLKPNKTETNTASAESTATTASSQQQPTAETQVSDPVDLTEENQKTVTKKDGLALLKQCLKEQEKIRKEELEQQTTAVVETIKDDEDIIGEEEVVAEAKSPSEIASKLNDLYFKHLEEETKEQSRF